MTHRRLMTFASMLFVISCAHLFAQSEKLVWMKAPDGRTYKTICTAKGCDIKEASYEVDLADPQYVHDRNKERKTFCQATSLKGAACSRSFRREETIQGLLRADWIVSKAGDLPAMTREQAEQLVDGIKR